MRILGVIKAFHLTLQKIRQMILKQLLVVIVIVAIAIFLLNIKMLFKKNGRLEKSCTAKHRVLHQKGLDGCTSCSKNPTECAIDEKEHHEFIHKKVRV